MKAVVYTAFGPPEVLQLKEVAEPTPESSEIRVKVHATSVHIGDVKMRGLVGIPRWQMIPARLFLGIRRPKRSILGMELAGEVDAVGSDVERFQIGDAVYALTLRSGLGGYAEYKCMPADGMVAIKPANISFEEAAVVPGGGITALIILRKAAIQSGQRVLIYGASGSVGTFSVQIAKSLGAEVTGVCSTANLDLVRSLGADHVVDYMQEDFSRSGETYDVVFDAVGKATKSDCKRVLKKTGVYLNVLQDEDKIQPADLDTIRELIEAGRLRSVIDRTYPLEEIVEAHKYVEAGHKKGNVAITVSGSTD